MTKGTVLKLVESLPDEFELGLLIEKLVFVDKVEQGLRDIQNGDTVSNDEVIRQVRS